MNFKWDITADFIEISLKWPNTKNLKGKYRYGVIKGILIIETHDSYCYLSDRINVNDKMWIIPDIINNIGIGYEYIGLKQMDY